MCQAARRLELYLSAIADVEDVPTTEEAKATARIFFHRAEKAFSKRPGKSRPPSMLGWGRGGLQCIARVGDRVLHLRIDQHGSAHMRLDILNPDAVSTIRTDLQVGDIAMGMGLAWVSEGENRCP